MNPNRTLHPKEQRGGQQGVESRDIIACRDEGDDRQKNDEQQRGRDSNKGRDSNGQADEDKGNEDRINDEHMDRDKYGNDEEYKKEGSSVAPLVNGDTAPSSSIAAEIEGLPQSSRGSVGLDPLVIDNIQPLGYELR